MGCCFRNRDKKKTEKIIGSTPFDDYCTEDPIPDRDFPLFKRVTNYEENKFRKTRVSKCIDEIYKEVETLKKDLPKSIYLRTYYKRPDLFQAAMVGLPNTPYEDGIYVFDLKLPDNYPKNPPKVIYHSHGRKLNPWVIDSKGHFRNKKLFNNFDRTKSSILLQVLLYIQHNVLNGKPYSTKECREPTEDEMSEDEYTEEKYEQHLIAECPLTPYLYAYQSMVDVVDNIPSHFKRLVCCHFKVRGDVICRAFDEIVEHHISYGQTRGFYGMLTSQMRVGRCYALPAEFDKVKVCKLRGNLARVFAENQANSMIADNEFPIQGEYMARVLKRPYIVAEPGFDPSEGEQVMV
ncbi:putative ubiquitin-conjugating enzyme E2 39 [Silene latifolia]|uniref:putative ubiquitin-conjugating enzyme E2 39 n=1 Tax=Silene latifolia TaxID=37657 RepID=UPI003D77741D